MGVPSFMSQLNSIINSLYQQEHIGARYQQIISNVTNERKNNVKKGSSQSSSSSSTSNNNINNNSNNSNNNNNKSNETKFQPPFISNRIHSKVFDCIYIDINPLIHGVVRGVQNSIDATNSSTTETSQKDSKKSSSQNKSESSSQNKSESSSSQKDSKKSSSSRPQDSKKSSSQNKSTTTDNTCDDKIVRGVIKSLEEVMTNFKAQTHWFISFDGVATKSKRIKQRSNRAKESKKRNGEKKNMSSSDSVDITENHTNNPVDISENHTNHPMDITENHTNDPVDISENHTNHPMDITENHTNVPNDEIMLDLADEEMSDDENNDNGTSTTTTVNMEKDHSPPLFEIPKKRSLSVEISPGTNLSKKIYEAVLNLAFHYSKTHNVTVYVSSSCRSGEGETKIIEHLRKYMQTTTSKKSNRSSSNNSSSGNNNNNGNSSSGNSSSNNSHNNTRPSTSVLIISHDSDMVLIPLSNPELNCSFNVLVPNGTRCSYGTMIDITGLKLLLYHLFKMNQVTSTMNPQNASMTSSSSIPSSSIMNQISSSIPSSSIMNNNDNNNHQISNHHDNNNHQISSSIPSSSINPQPSILPNSNEIIQQLCLDFVCISLLAGGCDYFNPFAKTLEHRWRRYFKLIQTEKTNYSIFTLKHDEKTNEYILNINTNNLLFVFGNYVRDKRSTIAPNPDNAIQFFKQLTACVLQFKGQLPIMEYFSRKLSMVDLLALIEREKKANIHGTSTQANDHGTSTLSNSTMEEDGSTSIMIQDLNHTMNGTMSGSSSSSTITITGSSSSTSSTMTTPLNTIENQSNTTTKTNNTPKKSSINPTFKITTSFQELVDTYHLTPLECLFSMITSHNSHALPHDKLIELFSFSPKLCDLLHIDSKFNYENGNDNHWIASNEPYELIRQGIMEWKEKYPTITDEVINNKHIGTIQFTCVGSGSSSNTVLLKHSGGLVGGAVQNDAKTKSTTTTTTTTTTTMTTTTSKSSSNNNNNNSNHSKDRQNKSSNEKENNQIQVLEETIRPFEACVPYPFVPGIYTLSRLRFTNDKIRYQRANTLNQYTLGEEFDRTVLDIPLTSKQVKIVKKKQLPPPPNPLKKKKSMQQQSMATTTCESLSVTESEVNRSGILQALLQKSNKLPESIAVNMDTSNGSENSLKKRKLNQLSTIQQSERKPKTVKLEQASTPAGQGQTTKQTSRRSKKKSSASSNNPSENTVSLPTAEPGATRTQKNKDVEPTQRFCC